MRSERRGARGVGYWWVIAALVVGCAGDTSGGGVVTDGGVGSDAGSPDGLTGVDAALGDGGAGDAGTSEVVAGDAGASDAAGGDGTGGGSDGGAPDVVDASPTADATADVGAGDGDGSAGDGGGSAGDGGGSADVQAPVCSAPPAEPPKPVGVFPDGPKGGAGIDAPERAAYEALRATVLADDNLHYIATWDEDAGAYRVDSAGGHVLFARSPQGIAVVGGDVSAVFPSTSPEIFGTVGALTDAFENPSGYTGADVGYAPGDPRVGFLPPSMQSYPLALERIAALFDAPDAPDLVVGHQPWSSGGGGSHGALSALQSRAALVIAGRGARKGVVIEGAATLPDVAPTILAALGAPTTGGVGPDGVYDDGLYLARQDGRVLWEALAEDPCERPKHVILLLFDGLLQTELLRQALEDAPDVDLPTFRALAQQGVVWRYGATTNFPSVSAPGHMTSGCGLWSGHHGILSNSYYRRSSQTVINPFSLLDDIQATIADPMKAVAIYESAIAPGFETLGQAAHRGLGAFDPVTGQGAFVAVINELSIGGADWTTIHLLMGAPPGPLALSLQDYELADNLAVTQVQDLLANAALPAPLILEASLVKTDGAGEVAGPHSDLMRQVLVETDARVGAMLAAYEARGVLDDTMIVLVSDHGMELQDPLRTTGVQKSLILADVKARVHSPGLVWLRTLEVEVALPSVTVRDHDNGAPLAGVTVGCDTCAETVETGADGVATLAPDVAPAMVTATHPLFNAQTVVVEEP